MCWARRRSRSSTAAPASSPRATTSAAPTRPARPSSRSPATSSSPRRPSACRCSAIRRRATRSARLLKSVAQFPERAHLVGAYALGKAQRVIRLLRDAGYDEPIYIHGALAQALRLLREPGHRSRRPRPATVETARQERLRRRDRRRPALGLRRPLGAALSRSARRASPRAGCASAQRAKQRGVELPLIISDHSDWDELTATIVETGASEVWVTHGREEALVRWCELKGIAARPLHLVGYEDEGDE